MYVPILQPTVLHNTCCVTLLYFSTHIQTVCVTISFCLNRWSANVISFCHPLLHTPIVQKWQRKLFRLDVRGDLYYYDSEKVRVPLRVYKSWLPTWKELDIIIPSLLVITHSQVSPWYSYISSLSPPLIHSCDHQPNNVALSLYCLD